jgi:Zn-dependent protease with chaperone function
LTFRALIFYSPAMTEVSTGRFAWLSLRDAAQETARPLLRYSVPAALLSAGLFMVGTGLAIAAAPLILLWGTAAGLVFNLAAEECREALTQVRDNYKVKQVASRLFRRETAFLHEQTGADIPPVHLTNSQFSYASYNTRHNVMFVSKSTLRTHTRPQILAILAHEIAHKEEPVKADWRELGAGCVRIARSCRAIACGLLPGLALILPVTSVIVVGALASLAPYVLNVALHTARRRMEYRADRYAAAACGTPVPLLQAFAKWERASKPKPASFTVIDSFKRRMSRLPRNPGEAFFLLANTSGPFTTTHPSLRQRRLKLIGQPRNRTQIEALKQAVQ